MSNSQANTFFKKAYKGLLMEQFIQFVVLPGILLGNDFLVRREVLEKIPVPMAFWRNGSWIWANQLARDLWYADKTGWQAVWPALGKDPAADPNGSLQVAVDGILHLSVEQCPVRNLAGDIEGQLVWVSGGLEQLAGYLLPRGMFVARDGRIIWANRMAQDAFNLQTLPVAWDQVTGIPPWDWVAHGDGVTVTVHRMDQWRVRLVTAARLTVGMVERVGEDSSGESPRPESWAAFLHEVRNPLTSLSGYVELAQGIAADERLTDLLQRMEEQVERLVDLVRQGDQEPSDTLTWEQVSAQEILARAWQLVQIRGPAVVMTCHDQELPVLRGDSERIRKILTGLLQNAADAMAESGGAITVTFGSQGIWQVLTVSDTGPGVPLDVMQGIFHHSRTTKSTGTGVGLLIVRRLAESLGGILQVRTIGTRGTTARLFWPKTPWSPRH